MDRLKHINWRPIAVLLVIIVVVLSFGGFGIGTSSAQDDDTDKPVSEMNTEEVLEYVQGQGLNSVLGVFFSYFAAVIPGFGRMAPKSKRFFVLFICLLVPVGAQLLLWYMNGTPDKTGTFLTELWDVTKAGLTAFSTSQIAHTRKL